MSDYQSLIADESEGVLTLRLNRPKANAFDNQMIDELTGALKGAGRSESVRCVLLTGEGRFFSAGQDVSAFADEEREVSFRQHLSRTYNPLVLRMQQLEKPIVGAINGPAAGAGLGIALATDVRLAGESALFVFGFTGIGLTTDSGTSLALPMLMGMARAKHMAFTNEPINAEQALQFGLVNQVVPDEELFDTALDYARGLAKGPTLAIGLSKRAFQHAMGSQLETTLEYEAKLQEIAGRSQDHQEGLNAFLEKRDPEYQGM